jgi:acetyl-CoA carboxylase carboxyl transferase beta subunit
MAVTVEIARRTPGPEPVRWTCQKCGHRDDPAVVKKNLSVCPQCGDHLRIGARERVDQLADPGSFVERWSHLRTLDPLSFNDVMPYPERFREAQATSGLNEALVGGPARIGEEPCILTVMDFFFMGGSMGSVVGERLWRACEAAANDQVPLVSVASSGGARMQEGAISLMQMAKTSCAVDLLNEARVPFVVVMADPCTGGVVASFASLADICIAEPGALLYFSGPRVIAETTKERLPADFGTAERNLALGHLDGVVPRHELKATIATYLRLLRGGGQGDGAQSRGTSGGAAGAARQGARSAGRMAEGAARRAGETVSRVGRVVLGRDRPPSEPDQDS